MTADPYNAPEPATMLGDALHIAVLLACVAGMLIGAAFIRVFTRKGRA